jgi:hypothetical protein
MPAFQQQLHDIEPDIVIFISVGGSGKKLVLNFVDQFRRFNWCPVTCSAIGIDEILSLLPDHWIKLKTLS